MGFLFSFSPWKYSSNSWERVSLCLTGQINTDLHWELSLSNMAFRISCHSFFSSWWSIQYHNANRWFRNVFFTILLSNVDIATNIGEECSPHCMLESTLRIALYYFLKVSLITFHEFLCSSSAQHLHISPGAVHNWANSKSLNAN